LQRDVAEKERLINSAEVARLQGQLREKVAALESAEEDLAEQKTVLDDLARIRFEHQMCRSWLLTIFRQTTASDEIDVRTCIYFFILFYRNYVSSC